MTKTLIAAAVATMSLAAVALPAHADQPLTVACDVSNVSIQDNETTIAMQLQQQGYDVSGVDEWAGCVRAFVTKADGTTGMAFFDPNSLKLVAGDAA
jgi:hypothetical protein